MSINDECLLPQQESPSPSSTNVLLQEMDSRFSQHPLLTSAAHASMLPAFSALGTPQGSSPSSSPSPLSLQSGLSHPISGDLPISLISSPSLGFEITANEQIESPVNASSPTIPSSMASTPAAYIFDSNLLPPTKITRADDDEEEDSKSVPACQWEGCGKQCLSIQQLVAHLEHDHTIKVSQYVCKWAGCTRQQKPFDARYKLVTHLRCHTGERPYKCTHDSCKRTFSRLENLKLHIRTHTGEKPYTCHHKGCEKRFNNTSDRAKHMKTHVTRKPYLCKYPGCNKAYTDPSSMRKHIKFSHRDKDRSASYSAPSPEQLIHNSFSAFPKLVKSAPSTPLQVEKEQETTSPNDVQATSSLLHLQNGVRISTQQHLLSTSINQPLVVLMPVTRDSQQTLLLANQSVPLLTPANVIHPSVSGVSISTNSSRESNANVLPLVRFLQPQQQLLVLPERTQSFTILTQPISPSAQICLAQPQTQLMVPLTQSTPSPSSCVTVPSSNPSPTKQVQPILLPLVPTTTLNH